MSNKDILKSDSYAADLYYCNTVIVGTGAAGYNAADRLWKLGQKDILLISENRTSGTSRNTGSDKQTYYKLTLSGNVTDSVYDMAKDLFEGQCVDGDIALCEASLSVQCFMKLVEIGVPFPRNKYGEYVGYKTDHDPRRRATSIGPYTSKRMTEQLEKSVQDNNVPFLDNTQVIKILSDGNTVYGLLCLNVQPTGSSNRFIIIRCRNVIYATGGPAGMYADSAYPLGHHGASGLAFEAGVCGKNLTEWQYGLASVDPRWNVSGTFMQVLPRVYSTDETGHDEKEFLLDYFKSPEDMLSKLFLKGYQWPFDVRKVADGSSIIDILVYLETCKGRKVYLDYTKNPVHGQFSYDKLDKEVLDYLTNASACFGSPYDRLMHMNAPAISFYKDKGVDLKSEPLQIALCAQHNNGGLGIDCWWQTNLNGFFAVGEVAASHGVYRPGGTALNSGQVGSTRAAQYIAKHYTGEPEKTESFETLAKEALSEMGNLADRAISDKSSIDDLYKSITEEMNRCGAAIRNKNDIAAYLQIVKAHIDKFAEEVKIENEHLLPQVFRYRDTLYSQYVYLSAMLDYTVHNGKSRGSALYTDPTGIKPFDQLPDTFTYIVDDGSKANQVQEVVLKDNKCKFEWRSVRPIPIEDDFFENVWRDYREHENIIK